MSNLKAENGSRLFILFDLFRNKMSLSKSLTNSARKVTSLKLIAILLLVIVSSAQSQAQSITKLFDLETAQLPQISAINNGSTLAVKDFDEFGGTALKVVFNAGDSFGLSNRNETNWAEFNYLIFRAFNPSDSDVRVNLAIRFRDRLRVTPPRASIPLDLQPGDNNVAINLMDLVLSAELPVSLSDVIDWRIQNSRELLTLYFSDFELQKQQTSSTQLANFSNRETNSRNNQQTFPQAINQGTTSTQALDSESTVYVSEIDTPVMFNTPLADELVSAMKIYPEDNPWNQKITDWPTHENSRSMIELMGAGLVLRYNPDMAYVLVPPDQPKVDVDVIGYPEESDPGPYPVPSNVPIEGWPVIFSRESGNRDSLSLSDVQRGARGGDRHAIVVDPVNHISYEFYRMFLTDEGWQADQASVFDLTTNKLRPDGWTSADAAGLPLFPAVVRYDELARGEIKHALRVTFPETRRAYVAPATHYASRSNDPNLPRMGERIRLRADFDISSFSLEVQIILRALKEYGMFVADNGIAWAISVTPDERISNLHQQLRRIRGKDFEIVIAPE